MNYQIKFFNLLTICEKSGKLIKGFDVSKEAVTAQKTKCILTASDVSPKTLKEVDFMCNRYPGIKVISLPFGMDEIKRNIGRKVGVMAVCDKGFAEKLEEYIAAEKESAQSE